MTCTDLSAVGYRMDIPQYIKIIIKGSQQLPAFIMRIHLHSSNPVRDKAIRVPDSQRRHTQHYPMPSGVATSASTSSASHTTAAPAPNSRSSVSSAVRAVESPYVPREEKEHVLRRLDGLTGQRSGHTGSKDIGMSNQRTSLDRDVASRGRQRHRSQDRASDARTAKAPSCKFRTVPTE